MYLSDTEVTSVFKKVFKWLRHDGYFFFRESCYRPYGKVLI